MRLGIASSIMPTTLEKGTMHTVIVLGGGFSLLLSSLLLGHAWGNLPGLLMGAKVFRPMWLVGAVVNLWV